MSKAIEKQVELVLNKGVKKNWFDRLPLVMIGVVSIIIGFILLFTVKGSFGLYGFIVGIVLFILLPIASLFQKDYLSVDSNALKGFWIGGMFLGKF